MIAPAVPASRLPPAATTPASANCEAPVKASRLSAQACQAVSPEPTAAAPNAIPEIPTASPRPTPSRTGRTARACSGAAVCTDMPANLGNSCLAGLVRSCRGHGQSGRPGRVGRQPNPDYLAGGPQPQAFALIGGRRDADDALEVSRQMRLVG